MIAKFAGHCETCDGAIAAGENVYYNVSTKKVSHYECVPETQPARRETPMQCATRLGFLPHAEAIQVSAAYWLDPKRTLPMVPARDGGAAPEAGVICALTRRGEREAHPQQDSLFGMSEKDWNR